MRHAGWQENEIVLAHDMVLAVDMHSALAIDYVIDLLLHFMAMGFDVSLRLIHRDPVVDVMRAGGVGHHQWLRQRAAEMVWKFQPRHFGDIADESLAAV